MHGVTQVRVGQFTFDTMVEGPDDGPPVLLLHGFPQDMTSWDPIARGLVADGFRVIRFDQRGISPGARPRHVGDYTITSLVADTFGLLDELGVARAHVIGHDWGGAVAWAMALQQPDRVQTLTALSTPHPSALAHSLRSSRQALRSWYMGLFQIPGLPERLLVPGGRGWKLLTTGLPPEATAHYATRAAEPAALTAMLHWYRAAGRALLTPVRGGGRVRVPTLYVWGARDPALGVEPARMTARYVDAPYRFVALIRHGHWLPERAAAEVMPEITRHLARSPA
jgi:pimeloyl-ACP methyl ester carboxylesterase